MGGQWAPSGVPPAWGSWEVSVSREGIGFNGKKSNNLWAAILAQTNAPGAVPGRLCSPWPGAPGIMWRAGEAARLTVPVLGAGGPCIRYFEKVRI